MKRATFFMLLALAGCSSSQSPVTAVATGAIVGQTEIAVSYSDFLRPSNIVVMLDNGSQQTHTDSNGYWSIDSVPVGTHTVTVSKTGFGAMELYNIQVAPNSIANAGNAMLCPVPSGTVHVDSIAVLEPQLPISNSSQWQVFVTFDSVTQRYAIFIDSTPNILPENPHLAAFGGTNLYSFYATLHPMGFKTGDTLFLSSCVYDVPASGNYEGTYYDPSHDQTRFIACGPKSNVIPFVMP